MTIAANQQHVSPSPRPETTATGRRGLPYLSALDGVRAVAVLAVMLFHTGMPWLPGGFLGVDIFFVLSGFLITSLILSELESTNRLDFKNFYVRRARRLLPALFLLLVGVVFLGAFLATDAAEALRRDIPAALTYVTNWVYIFSDQSYFEVIGRPPLLQHLWSLAVEEQFYLIWPIVAYLGFRRGTRNATQSGRSVVRHWALIGALGSTVIMVVLSLMGGYPDPNDGSRVYFGTDGHAMGLLIGAAVATFWLPQKIRKTRGSARIVINTVAVIAPLILLWIMRTTTDSSAWLYRGGFLIFALIVALWIMSVSHPDSKVGEYLGKQPMRYIGERSYGLYLWHWPVFLVLRPDLDIPISGFANVVLTFAITFGLAELSYRFVEEPIRRLGFKQTLRRVRNAFSSDHSDHARRTTILASIFCLLFAVATFRVVTYETPEPDFLGGKEEVLAEAPAKPEPVAGEITGTDPNSALAPGVLAIGESVMLGARNGLTDRIKQSTVDASIGRQAADVLTRIKQLKKNGALRETVILHTGSNGYVTEDQLKAMLNELSEVQRIVVVNVSVPRIWQDPNNELIESLVQQTPNTVLADWHAAETAESGMTVSDGVHLTSKGIRTYAKTIKAALGQITTAQTEIDNNSPPEPATVDIESFD